MARLEVDASIVGGSSSQIITGDIIINNVIGETLILLADATSGNITVTLGTAASLKNKNIQVKKMDATINIVTIDPDDSETIDDALTLVINTQYDAPKVYSDGTEWVTV